MKMDGNRKEKGRRIIMGNERGKEGGKEGEKVGERFRRGETREVRGRWAGWTGWTCIDSGS